MSTANASQAAKIDSLMEQASAALVHRKYLDAERLASSALRKAHACHDYARMMRILLPLQEARRFKRDLARDAGAVTIISSELPTSAGIKPGCYLICPPRVGVDGRSLRELADMHMIPTIVVVREPDAKDGQWPVVAVGPVTVRTKVPAPTDVHVPTQAKKNGKMPHHEPAAPASTEGTSTRAAIWGQNCVLPSVEWFLKANEALGDAAISQVPVTLPATSRVDDLFTRLESHPDHEKLHQRLAEACKQAILEPARKPKASDLDELEAEFGADSDE